MKDFEKIKDNIYQLIGYKLPIKNKDDFLSMLKQVNDQKFNPILLEKDFRLTIVLYYISKELPELRFKGGTCLNKVYFPYFRLSEDLDFSFPIDHPLVDSNNKRKQFARHIREKVKYISNTMGRILNDDKYHHKKALGDQNLAKKEHTYLKYFLRYNSVYIDKTQTIKIELTYSSKQYLPSEQGAIQSIFVDPILETSLFPEQSIQCLHLDEMIAEKCRAAMTRRKPVIRDFFDLRYLSSQGKDIFQNTNLIINKCHEISNLQRTLVDSYPLLQDQIETDLYPVLHATSGFDLKNIYDAVLLFQQKIFPHFSSFKK